MKHKNRCVRMAVFLLVLALTLPLFGTFGVRAAGQEQSGNSGQKRKVVSIIFDDSGSMKNLSVSGVGSSTTRHEEARYALKMLITLLNTGDKLFVSPLNDKNLYTVDLSQKALDQNRSLAWTSGSSYYLSLFQKDSNSGTPFGEPATRAINALKKAGMQTTAGSSGKSDTDYWLIVLTDGEFDETGQNTAGLADMIKAATVGYNGLHVAYIAFSDGAAVMPPDQEEDINRSVPFNAYATDPKDPSDPDVRIHIGITNVMQQIAAKITGRYRVSGGEIQPVGGSKTTYAIRLPEEYPVNSISVIAQNFNITDAQTVGIKYEVGAAQKPIAKQETKIASAGTISGAYSGVIAPAPGTIIQGGTITLTFPSAVKKEDITVLFEPSIYIVPYILYQDKKVSSAWVNGHLKANDDLKTGDEIRVGYAAYYQGENGKQLFSDFSKLGAITSASATYAGNLYPITVSGDKAETADLIRLVEHRNEVVVSAVVSINGSEYTLFGSLFLNIVRDPTQFRIDANTPVYDENAASYRAEFTVYVNRNTPVSISGSGLRAGNIRCEVQAYDKSETPVPIRVGAENGKVFAILDAKDILNTNSGPYTITVIAFDESDPNSVRSTETSCEINPSFEITGSIRGKDAAEATLLIDGKAFGKLGDITQKEIALSLGGKPLPLDRTAAEGNKLVAYPADPLAYGKYRLEVAVGRVKGEVSASFYPQRIAATVEPDTLGTIRQHALKTNRNDLTFRLTADGGAIDFDNPILEYHLYFGTKEIPADRCLVSGNTLTYVPKAGDADDAYLSPGTKEIKLTVSCKGGSVPPATATATFELTKTEYVLEAVPVLQKEVDRFDIGHSNAGVYFRLIRDGEPVGEEEMRQFYEEGQFKVKLPTAMSLFLLPCGAQTGVEVVNGEPLLYCKAVKDQPGILSLFTSMLLFNGNKTVTVSYLDAEAADAVIFTPSPVFQYIWRILLIALIVYVIIYIIGFFTGKTFPKGVYVAVSLEDDDGVKRPTVKKINLSPWNLVKWHIKRFFTGPLRNQPPIAVPRGTLSLTKGGALRFAFKNKKACRARYITGGSVEFDDFLTKLKKSMHGTSKSFDIKSASGKPVKPKTLLSSFDLYDEEIDKGLPLSMGTDEYYINFDYSEETVGRRVKRVRSNDYLVFYVRSKRNK